MKTLTLSLFFFGILLTINAQNETEIQTFINKKCGNILLTLPKQNVNSHARFKNIEVLDSRPDTSRAGIILGSFSQDQVLFHTSATALFTNYLNYFYSDPAAPMSILMVIKKLWLSDSACKRPKNSFFPQTYFGTLEFRAEIYYKIKDGFLPLTFLDTIVYYGSRGTDDVRHLLPELLQTVAERAATADIDELLTRKKVVTFQQIDAFNRSRFAYPIDHPATLQKGVYASLEEFRANQPAIKEYEIRKGKDSLMELYIKDEEGKLYYTHTMWGFCDGEHCYAMMDGNLFPILPVQHAFYVLGSKEYQIKKNRVPFFVLFPPLAIGGLATMNEYVKRKLRLLSLNIETGHIY